MNRFVVFAAGIVLAFTSLAAGAQEARTVEYHSQDIVRACNRKS